MVVGVGGGFDDRDRGGARTGAPSGRSVPGHPRYTPCVTRARGFRIIAASLAGPEDWDSSSESCLKYSDQCMP